MPLRVWPRSRASLEIRSGRCLTLRRPGDPCRLCRQSCPVAAISRDTLPLPADHCVGCLACARVCPTGAIDVSDVVARSLQTVCRQCLIEGERDLRVVCSESLKGVVGDIEVDCLGGLTTRLLLISIVEGASDITLLEGDCRQCPSFCSMSGLDATISETNTLASIIDLEGRVVRRPMARRRFWWGRYRSRRRPSSRGAFLAGIRGRLRTVVESSAALHDGSGPAPSREWLRRRVSERTVNRKGIVCFQAGPGLPMGQLTVDDSCRGCAACMRVCPANALSRRVKGRRISLVHVPSRCTGCGACAATCPVGSITLDWSFDAELLERDDEVSVFSMSKCACVACGVQLDTEDSESRACTPCRRRYSELHIKSLVRRHEAEERVKELEQESQDKPASPTRAAYGSADGGLRRSGDRVRGETPAPSGLEKEADDDDSNHRSRSGDPRGVPLP